MWTQNSKSLILFIYLNGASTSPFSGCSVNNKGYKEDWSNYHKIFTISQMFISSDVFVAVAVVAA